MTTESLSSRGPELGSTFPVMELEVFQRMKNKS